ncbi:ammonium transporter family-domain-containing protein [Zopfochytrium polystomum]|nr:ammonium transporter family-domain-containing protein [Zopfochytrium polystomum]
MILSAAIVFFMGPGLGFFYSGMSRRKNALSLIMLCMVSIAVVSIQWTIFGYSLAFAESTVLDPNDPTADQLASSNASPFLGSPSQLAGLSGVGFDALRIAPAVSSAVFCLYQLQFATVTAGLVFGSAAERIRLVPSLLFIFLWTTIVYDPVAYWTWSYHGWLRNLDCLALATTQSPCGRGVLDFAGGGPVEVVSGFAGLAIAVTLGKRRRIRGETFRPHNLTFVFLGTGILWFGWLGFNGGSAGAGTARAGMAALVTHLAACAGALSWPLVDYATSPATLSGFGLCSGAVAAMVAITPASGYVAPWASLVIGAVAGVLCNFACRLKGYVGVDDALDVWGVHGVGGMWGLVATGLFAQPWIAALDGSVILAGAVEGRWRQVGYQLVSLASAGGWSFCATAAIVIAMRFVAASVPALAWLCELRMDKAEEVLGSDLALMDELAYEMLENVGKEPERFIGSPVLASPEMTGIGFGLGLGGLFGVSATAATGANPQPSPMMTDATAAAAGLGIAVAAEPGVDIDVEKTASSGGRSFLVSSVTRRAAVGGESPAVAPSPHSGSDSSGRTA